MTTKPAKSQATESTGKPRGRKAVTLREAQNVPLNQNLSVPHLPMTDERKQTFLARLAESGNIAQAASHTDGGIGSARSYRRLQSNDPVFARAMQDALDGYAARVNQQVNRAAGIGDDVEMIPLVSAGEIIKDPVTKQPIYIQKYSDKILLQLARSTNPAMRDHKVVTNQNGQPIEDPNDPKIILSVSDLERLDFADSEQLIRICRLIYANRLESFTGPDMKVISSSKEFEGDYEDVTQVPANADDFDPHAWENEEESAHDL